MEDTLQEKLISETEQPKPNLEKGIIITSETNEEDLKFVFNRIAAAAGKLAVSFFCNFGTRGLLVYYLKGTNQPVVQAAATLGLALLSVLSMTVFVSLNAGGLFYRLTHTYGAKDFRLMGLYLHRGCIINVIALVVCSILVTSSIPAFRKFGYEEDLLEHMATFIYWSLPSLIGFSFFQIFNSYLNAADIFHVSSQVQIASCVAYVISGYILIVQMELGIIGAVLTLNIQQTTSLIYILIYIYKNNPVPGTLFPLEEDSYKGLWDLFKYQFTSGAMLFLEYGGYEMIYLFAGILSVPEVAGLMTALFCQANFFAFALSVSIATSGFVGNAMGELKVQKAKFYLKVGTFMNLGVVLIAELIVGIFAPNLARFYSNDPDTIAETTRVLRLFMLVFPTDYVGVVMAGGMRSIGLEKAGSMIVLVNLYCISMPLTAILVLAADAGVTGVMMAFIVAPLLNVCCYIYQFKKTNWEEQAFMISRKLKKDHEELKNDQIDEGQEMTDL